MEQIQKDIKRFGAWGSELNEAAKPEVKVNHKPQPLIGRTKRQILRIFISLRNKLQSLFRWH